MIVSSVPSLRSAIQPECCAYRTGSKHRAGALETPHDLRD